MDELTISLISEITSGQVAMCQYTSLFTIISYWLIKSISELGSDLFSELSEKLKNKK